MFPDNDHRHADAEPDSAPVNHATLVQWKSEIRDFFVATEQKLSQFQNAQELQDSPEIVASAPQAHWADSKSIATIEQAPANQESREGSLDRLQVIKHRLAAQLENSRR